MGISVICSLVSRSFRVCVVSVIYAGSSQLNYKLMGAREGDSAREELSWLDTENVLSKKSRSQLRREGG